MPWGDGRASDRFGFPHSNHRRCQMHASNICTPIADHIGTIFVAIELSQKSWLAVMHSADRSRLSRHKLESGDAAGLLGLIESVRARAAREDGSDRRRALAADPDGALPRRAAGGADRAGAEPGAGGRTPGKP